MSEVKGAYGVLMPLIRRTLWKPDGKAPGGWSEIRECSVLRQLLINRSVSQIETAILGLERLRDTGQLDWLEKGQKCTCRAFYYTRNGVRDMFGVATEAYWRETRIKKPRPIERINSILWRVLRDGESPDNAAWRAKYVKHLRSPEWKSIRQRILARAAQRCEQCDDIGVPLDVHHLTYARLGRELDTDLIALCLPCHTEADFKRSKGAAS